MRCWVDTDVGDDPDDMVALACAAAHPEVELAGVSTIGRDTPRRRPPALLACCGEPFLRVEPASLVVDADGRVRRAPEGTPVRIVVAADRNRLLARVRALLG